MHTDSDIAFDGFRTSNMSSPGNVTYSGTLTNHGFSFNATNGEFIAPRTGIYAFHFRAVANDGSGTYVKLLQNGIQKAATYRKVPQVLQKIYFIF